MTVDGIPREFSTKKKWSIKCWSQKNGTVTDNRQDAKSLRAYLDFIAQKVLLCWIKLNSEGVEITSKKLIESITGRSKEKKMIMEFYIC
ncbi:hypothetical protein COR50_07340 [Chitinophaga caeni]|uniref:Arm DNA-binding domain-containing protein n=1 Tax=Chitinophaga caeni TaxID=2029983 RepID=A0A291QT52_9BACT|nr:hypothetical protein COR50_07340 [Chitinophaga caeni]